jgi:glycerol kinase
MPYLLAIDQGTTSTRAMIFDERGNPVARAQKEFAQIFPRDGWVEHDAEVIWADTVAVCKQVLPQEQNIAGIGITNQRETTVIWERSSGKPIHNAIVWQDRRTADVCRELSAAGHDRLVRERTGLVIDAYFSATKIAWLLDHVSGARAAAERGELCFGTIDSFLLWRLTGGRVHATDATNASRTSLYDIHSNQWDDDLLRIFRVPRAMLPEVRDCSSSFGYTAPGLFERSYAIGGIAGDQQAATIGQACVQPGMIKSTYGTGCFLVLNTGSTAVSSKHGLLTTIAYRLGGATTYAIEGSIFNAGTAVQWLRDRMQIIAHASECEALARSLSTTNGVFFVPAFTGLGAPHWDPDARGTIVGLTRDSGRADIVRAALEAVAYQTKDLIDAMRIDGGKISILRVDGGMTANAWLMQFLADCLGIPVERPRVTETTALGAAYLAGMTAGVFPDITASKTCWTADRTFTPSAESGEAVRSYAGWRRAVRQTVVK